MVGILAPSIQTMGWPNDIGEAHIFFYFFFPGNKSVLSTKVDIRTSIAFVGFDTRATGRHAFVQSSRVRASQVADAVW